VVVVRGVLALRGLHDSFKIAIHVLYLRGSPWFGLCCRFNTQHSTQLNPHTKTKTRFNKKPQHTNNYKSGQNTLHNSTPTHQLRIHTRHGLWIGSPLCVRVVLWCAVCRLVVGCVCRLSCVVCCVLCVVCCVLCVVCCVLCVVCRLVAGYVCVG